MKKSTIIMLAVTVGLLLLCFVPIIPTGNECDVNPGCPMCDVCYDSRRLESVVTILLAE